jgi:hypothetical protein
MKYKFVFVSKNEIFKMPEDELNKYDDIISLYFPNNSESLAKIYNSVLNADNGESDYIFLIHSDVVFNISDTISHLNSINGKYDVIGLCGCSKISVGQSPLNWYCGSIPYPNDRWGCVTHGELNGQISFFNIHHPNILDHEVACIDGLCIIFTRKAINSGLRFDEKLSPYDFYDTDISMQTILNYKMKLGVIVRKELQHWSAGKSILTPEFLKNEEIFRAKWGFKKH